MKKLYFSFLFVASSMVVVGQDCSNGRYSEEVFPNFSVQSDVVYGSNLNYQGNSVTLLLDVYTPDGDTETDRPLIIFIHGGSFVGGSKTEGDIVGLAQEYAKKGYVTSAMNYRIGMNGIPFPGPTQGDATEAVMRATQDSRAAVRFFRKSVDVDGNPYGIDPENIYLVGYSAGGFVSLHHAHLDKTAEIPSYINQTRPGLGGGIEGLSGNPGYSSEVKAVVSLAGAIGELEWIEADGAPILSLHGNNDGTVPYGSQTIYLLGAFPIMLVHGSSSVHTYADSIGLKNCFKSFAGHGHSLHLANAQYYDTTTTYINQFLQHFVCGATEHCVEHSLSISENFMNTLNMYPNPASSSVTFTNQELMNGIVLMDFSGRVVKEIAVNNTNHKLDISNLPAGVYFARISDNYGAVITRKLIIQ
jgi:para-nitrobenzyl esterase